MADVISPQEAAAAERLVCIQRREDGTSGTDLGVRDEVIAQHGQAGRLDQALMGQESDALRALPPSDIDAGVHAGGVPGVVAHDDQLDAAGVDIRGSRAGRVQHDHHRLPVESLPDEIVSQPRGATHLAVGEDDDKGRSRCNRKIRAPGRR